MRQASLQRCCWTGALPNSPVRPASVELADGCAVGGAPVVQQRVRGQKRTEQPRAMLFMFTVPFFLFSKCAVHASTFGNSHHWIASLFRPPPLVPRPSQANDKPPSSEPPSPPAPAITWRLTLRTWRQATCQSIIMPTSLRSARRQLPPDVCGTVVLHTQRPAFLHWPFAHVETRDAPTMHAPSAL